MLASCRLLCPDMIACGVIVDEIQHRYDASLPKSLHQMAKPVERTQMRCGFAITAHGIPPVVLRLRRSKYRHQVQIGDAQRLQIGDFFLQILKRSRPEVHITHRTCHRFRHKPSGILLPKQIEFPQSIRPVGPRCRERVAKLLKRVRKIGLIPV